jgi:hypothetical protein
MERHAIAPQSVACTCSISATPLHSAPDAAATFSAPPPASYWMLPRKSALPISTPFMRIKAYAVVTWK